MRHVLLIATLLASASLWATSPSRGESAKMRVGAIDFFGTTGINVQAVQAALPVKLGDQFGAGDVKSIKSRIRDAVQQSTGHPPTDVTGVCCDAQQQTTLYIGLGGRNSQAVQERPAPSGHDCLPGEPVQLYTRAVDAILAAVERDQADEDHDQGFALSQNPAARARQLEVREYAKTHARLVEGALRDCSSAHNREAAAMILGYADRAHEQIEALVRAADDPDSDVRNNAIRALWVLAAADPRGIPTEPFLLLLNSSLWVDRNKAGLALSELTKNRPPELLTQIRQEAMDSLVEMARWHSEGHAEPYRMILGRLAGWDDTRTDQAIAANRVEEIIAAARRPAEAREPSRGTVQ